MVAAAGMAPGCQVSTDVLYERTFFCDGAAVTDSCGSTRQGQSMTCYKARQVGARDFCTERCAEGRPDAEGNGWRCVDTKAKLRTCRPSDGAGSCAQPDTECLRTNVLGDEGVCMTMNTCSEDAQCRDPGRPSCMGPLIRNWYGGAAGVHADHSSCLQTGCRARNSACSPGESCLPNVLGPESSPLDICVPNCDENLNCPPNYFCYRKVSGAAVPAVCIPGILGFRCLSSMDCLVGECKDTGDGYKLCVTECASDADCARFGSTRGPFMCAPNAGGRKFCQNPRAFVGSNCRSDNDCRSHESCVARSPYYDAPMTLGECRPRCGPELPCKNRGGVPHVCISVAGASTCYPGRFHIPCDADTDCIGTLQCLEVVVPGKQDQPERRPRCSVLCRTDEECAANRFVEGGAYCSSASGGRCVAKHPAGLLCTRDAECASGSCKPSPAPADQERGLMRCQ